MKLTHSIGWLVYLGALIVVMKSGANYFLLSIFMVIMGLAVMEANAEGRGREKGFKSGYISGFDDATKGKHQEPFIVKE
jgi:hypothetical protein